MFNLSLPELVVIGAAALLVFGPRRLPELAKGLGKGIRDFRKALEGQDEEEKKKTDSLAQPSDSAQVLEPQKEEEKSKKG